MVDIYSVERSVDPPLENKYPRATKSLEAEMPRRRFLTAEDMGSAAWKELRLVILARDGRICQVCAAVATAVDHIVPRSQGGRSTPENLRATCKTCNSLKSRSEASLAALRRRQAGVVAPTPRVSPAGDMCTCEPGCRCFTGSGDHGRHWCL